MNEKFCTGPSKMVWQHDDTDKGWTKRIFTTAGHLLENFSGGQGFIALGRYYAAISKATAHPAQHISGDRGA